MVLMVEDLSRKAINNQKHWECKCGCTFYYKYCNKILILRFYTGTSL